ncbi:hypothetical protein [Streptomyces sasae]|uniref:hypothetical protein n=1 Tax=Streptomyces sasae TaxID=1266772 RepID=UPI00292FB7B0|nr:hypothetical protein [Streptomyces sasae]
MSALRRCRIRLRVLGTARLRMAVLFAALAATTLTLLTSLPAHAAPSPTPSASSTAPSTGTAPSQKNLEDAQRFMEETNEQLSKQAQAALMETMADGVRKELPDEGGLLGIFNVTDANNVPISVYSVQSDTGSWKQWDLGIMNFLTESCFMVTKWLIAFCCWLIGWTLSFGLAKLLLSPALAIANSLHSRVIMEMGLPSLFLAMCALICTARIFFGDRARGWGDAALSIVLASLTTTLLASTPQTLLGQDGAINMTRGFALQVADVILDADPTTPWATNDVNTPATSYSLTRPLTDALTDAFIVKPAMLLQYGQVFEGKCAVEYGQKRIDQIAYDRETDKITKKVSDFNNFLDISPSNLVTTELTWGESMAIKYVSNHYGGVPMDTFEKDCVKGDVDTAKKASLDKLGGSLFLLVASAIVTVLITGLAGSFLTAQVRIAWDAIRGEPALLAGTIPGFGRAFMWDWVASVWRSLAQMLVAVTSLAVFIIILKAILDPVQTDWGRELTLRFLAVDVVSIAAVKRRKALQTRTQQIANNLKAKLSSNRIGGTHGSIFTPAATPISKSPHLAKNTARGLVRGALATTALATGNPLAAIGYAMPQSIGATALMSRLSRGRGRGGPARPAAPRPAGRSRRPAPPASASAPSAPGIPPRPTTAPPRPLAPPRPTRPPRPGPPPRPTHRPGSQSARPAGVRPGNTPNRHRPRHQPPVQPTSSPRQQRLRQRLDRGIRRGPSTPRPSLLPNRASRDEYEAYLDGLEEAELQRRAGEDGDDE